MRTKLLGFSLAACLVGLAVWYDVHYSSSSHPGSDPGSDNEIAPSAQGAPQQTYQSEKIPEKYRPMVRKGLDYLVRNQRPDGYWEGDDGKHPVAMTGLVGLALLMDTEFGDTVSANYPFQIRKAVDWLMANSRPERDGLIFSEHASETARYMEGHGLATLFLAGVCQRENRRERPKQLTEVLTHAVKYIAKAQSSQGGWYHTSKVEGHDFAVISATAIQIQALQAAENAGIAIPGDAINSGLEYLKTAIAESAKTAADEHSSRLADAAAALACRCGSVLHIRRRSQYVDEWCKQWFKYCEAELPLGVNASLERDAQAHYYYAQTLFNHNAETWVPYRTAIFDHLQSRQHKDGSWPAGNGISVGPVHSTAVWCTMLQLDNENYPSRSRAPLLTS
jgi:hypothetical protein